MEARSERERLERRRRSAAMNKCPCGNVAGLNSTHCGRCRDEQAAEDAAKLKRIDIVFDGPPGPEGPRFVEVEDGTGKSICLGEWVHREDGYWALRFVR